MNHSRNHWHALRCLGRVCVWWAVGVVGCLARCLGCNCWGGRVCARLWAALWAVLNETVAGCRLTRHPVSVSHCKAAPTFERRRRVCVMAGAAGMLWRRAGITAATWHGSGLPAVSRCRGALAASVWGQGSPRHCPRKRLLQSRVLLFAKTQLWEKAYGLARRGGVGGGDGRRSRVSAVLLGWRVLRQGGGRRRRGDVHGDLCRTGTAKKEIAGNSPKGNRHGSHKIRVGLF